MLSVTKQAMTLEDTSPIPDSGLSEYVVELARHYGVVYVKTPQDNLAEIITRLSDDDIEIDDVQRLLIELKRAGVISVRRMGQILVNYLREKFDVRSL